MVGHQHVGSQAVRRYFEQNGGILGLHGHIHETVDVSGRYEDRVGDTIVVAPGNDPFDHPTNYYTNYSKILQALIVEIIGKDVKIRRDCHNLYIKLIYKSPYNGNLNLQSSPPSLL